MADKIANALVSSHLDYCNSLFRSLFFFNMLKLQYIQNTLGRIVTNCNRYSRATPILKQLHWLPVGFCKTCFIQMHDLRSVRQYLNDEAGVLAADALVSSQLEYCNSLFRGLFFFNMLKLQYIQTHLVGLSQIAIDTHRLLLLSNNSIGCQLNFGVFLKLPLWFVSFFTVVTQAISALICLFIMEDMA